MRFWSRVGLAALVLKVVNAQGLRFRDEGLGLRVSSLGFRADGWELEVEGLRFRVRVHASFRLDMRVWSGFGVEN